MYAIINQRNLERINYPMLQLVFAGCLNLLELFQALRVMCHTTVNHSGKLGTMQTN